MEMPSQLHESILEYSDALAEEIKQTIGSIDRFKEKITDLEDKLYLLRQVHTSTETYLDSLE